MMKNGIFILLATVLSSCYVSKSLDRTVKVSLNENFSVFISNTGNSSFSERYNEEEYKRAFIEGMKNEFAGSHIVLVESIPEFLISITDLTIVESTKSETVSDVDSPDNGNEHELSSLKVSAKGKVDHYDGAPVGDWSAGKSKDEKVTNNRTGGQIIAGQNKEQKIYREKEFSDDEALELARKCGKRAGVRIVKEIVRAFK